MTTPGAPGLPVIPEDSVTPGDSVRPFFTGQEAQKEKIDERLDRSELPVLNSPGSLVQLEHNVHMQQRNMPNLQVEHFSEYSEVGQDSTNSDSSNVKAYEFSKRTQLPHSEHVPPGIGHTGNPLGIGHTGNRSDQEHGSVRTRHRSDVSRSSLRDSNTRRNSIPLQHADPGEHSPASMIRHRPARSRSRSYDSVSRSRSTSRSRGKKKSHKKRKPSTSRSSSCRSSSSSSSESERERKRHKSKKKKKKKHSKHSKSHSTKRDKSKKKHKRKRSPSPYPSLLSSSVSSDSSSSPRRSPAKKKSRLASRSPSPAGVNPQSAHRAASPASHRDHLILYADSNDELYSHSEDAQDSGPDNTNPVPENQSEISQEDIGFSGLIDEVFKLLPLDMFPRKTEEFLGGNRPRSSIELEVGKATKKNCSLPQSR